MSRPVLGVVSVFAVLAAWKDFIWSLVVLPDPAKQPLSVRLPRLAGVTELDEFLATRLISCSLPMGSVLVFQRFFLRGGLQGARQGVSSSARATSTSFEVSGAEGSPRGGPRHTRLGLSRSSRPLRSAARPRR